MTSRGQNRGCWFAISRCFNSRAPDERTLSYNKIATENIEFENLETAERRALEAKKKKQVVTDQEKEHVMNGDMVGLLEQQRRLDEERDALLRKQEEDLRKEEEAYYKAKREAANNRAKQVQKAPVSLEVEQSDQSDVAFNFPTLPAPLIPSTLTTHPSTTVVMGGASLMGCGNVGLASLSGQGTVSVTPSNHDISSEQKDDDDDDFDQFLESVKVKQLSVTKKSDPVPDLPPVAVNLSDSEEEIDFGFWEKAPEPSSRGSAPVSTEATKHNHTDNPHEVDLNLL